MNSNIYIVKLHKGNNVSDTFLLNADRESMDDMVSHVNSAIADYNDPNDDLIGHELEKTLRDIRGVSQSMAFHNMIDSYPDFATKFYSCDRISYEKIEFFTL